MTVSIAKNQQPVTSKTPATRLLDLLAGWSAYVSQDEDNGTADAVLSAEQVGDLYQAAGQLSETWDGLSGDDQDRAVHAFVEQHVLPLLLRRSKVS